MSDAREDTQQEPLSSPEDWVADHVRRYVESDGADGHIMNGVPCALITHRGRTSGKLRRTPLVYGRDGDRFVIIASRGGSNHHPAWFLNLQADPRVHLQVNAEHFDLRARVAEGEERSQTWEMMVGVFGDFNEYQKKTQREIPVVILEASPPT